LVTVCPSGKVASRLPGSFSGELRRFKGLVVTYSMVSPRRSPVRGSRATQQKEDDPRRRLSQAAFVGMFAALRQPLGIQRPQRLADRVGRSDMAHDRAAGAGDHLLDDPGSVGLEMPLRS
jgi:hypothetical protein